MKPSVLFTPVVNARDTGTLLKALKKILNAVPWDTVLPQPCITAVKLHFGEKNNTGYIHPSAIKCLVDKLKSLNAKPFLTDTNVLYHGSRTNAVDHLSLAEEHGFTRAACNAPIIIADGLLGENVMEIPFKGKHCTTLKAAGILKHLQAVISAAHFKGHMLTGFGGTLKNIGMGFASRAGKQIQHSAIKPSVIEQSCVFCKQCIGVCPVNAIRDKNNKAFIDQNICVGCADCVVACQFKAIELTWEESIPVTGEKVAEYATGIIRHIPHSYFINFAIRITKECDCLAKDDPSMVNDIGIFASSDPIAVDKASLDAVNHAAGRDIFKELHPKSDYQRKLAHAAALGLGSMEYSLTEIQ